MNLQKIIKYYIPLIFYMSLIWYISSQPIELSPLCKIPFSDKIAHLLEYAIFGWLLTRVVNLHFTNKKLTSIVVISALLWGIIDEIHQSFVPTRQPSFYDIIFDCIGAWIGSVVWVKRQK